MLHELINHSPDLKRLQDEGYNLQLIGGYALLHDVPYVNHQKKIHHGTLVSNLMLAGNQTTRPDTHVIHFIGDHPCQKDGSLLTGIQHASAQQKLAEGVVIQHSFSNKPQEGYVDYYQKFTRYIEMIVAPAYSLDSSVTAQTYKVVENQQSPFFHYEDTNASRANIGAMTQKLENHKVGIIGLGGTGSYILDLVSKTPVAEIHLFDGDLFLQHNAFRSPGAPPISLLAERRRKTDYFCTIYSNMHKGVISHPYYINTEKIHELLELDFVFISLDEGSIKKEIINCLVENSISFIDVGIGVQVADDSLFGILRVTTATEEKHDHLNQRISYHTEIDDAYSTNIQIAELNMMNASLAVLKWKKILGFYQDFSNEHHTTYTINTGDLMNDE